MARIWRVLLIKASIWVKVELRPIISRLFALVFVFCLKPTKISLTFWGSWKMSDSEHRNLFAFLMRNFCCLKIILLLTYLSGRTFLWNQRHKCKWLSQFHRRMCRRSHMNQMYNRWNLQKGKNVWGWFAETKLCLKKWRCLGKQYHPLCVSSVIWGHHVLFTYPQIVALQRGFPNM